MSELSPSGVSRLAAFCLAAAITAAAALLVTLDSHLGFIADDWELLVGRKGWSPGALLDPFNGNVVLAPTLIYKLLISIFGMGSAVPFYLVSISLFLAGDVLLFVYLRHRVGDWLALIGVVMVLFLGAAFEDFLWAFQMGFFGSMAAGMGMLVALDRESRRGDRLACGLLLCSLAFSSLGIAFAAGAIADIALGRSPKARRAYLALLPLAAYALWWAGWGHLDGTQISLHSALHLPAFVFDAAAAGVTSLLGLTSSHTAGSGQSPLLCQLVVVGALLTGSAVALRRRRISRGLAVALVLALALWVLEGLARTPGRYPTSSRYQYPSAVFILLIAAEAIRRLRIRTLIAIALTAVSFVAAFSGAVYLYDQYRNGWEPETERVRSFLAAVEIAGRAANPAFRVTFHPSITVSAHTYLKAVSEYGSPAFNEGELSTRPEDERVSADRTLASVLGLGLRSPREGERTLHCQSLDASTTGYTGATLPYGRFTLATRSNGAISVLLARFADAFSVPLGTLKPGVKVTLRIPADESAKPWDLGLRGAGSVRLCAMRMPDGKA